VAVAVFWCAMLLAVGVDYRSSVWIVGLVWVRRSLQCGPALVQPLVLSPKACTCMPRLALASLPLTSHEMVVSASSDACSKCTVPLTLESPRRTATGRLVSFYRFHDIGKLK
jgi:hypothetical protein